VTWLSDVGRRFIFRALTGNVLAVLIRVLTEGTQHLMTQREFLNETCLALNCYTATVLVQFGINILLVAEPNQFRPDPARKLTADLYDIYHCCVCSEKLLMMDRGTVRNI